MYISLESRSTQHDACHKRGNTFSLKELVNDCEDLPHTVANLQHVLRNTIRCIPTLGHGIVDRVDRAVFVLFVVLGELEAAALALASSEGPHYKHVLPLPSYGPLVESVQHKDPFHLFIPLFVLCVLFSSSVVRPPGTCNNSPTPRPH